VPARGVEGEIDHRIGIAERLRQRSLALPPGFLVDRLVDHVEAGDPLAIELAERADMVGQQRLAFGARVRPEIIVVEPFGEVLCLVPQQGVPAHGHPFRLGIIEHIGEAGDVELDRIGTQPLPFELVLGNEDAAIALEQRGISGVGERAGIGAGGAPRQARAEAHALCVGERV
jgi:hypothetical protein